MFVIGEAVVDEGVAGASFACEVRACRGACCTIPGGRGAPLEDAEVEEIAGAFPHAKQFLGEVSLRAIGSGGFVEGTPGDYATACIGGRECVFAYFEEGIARCSFEAAYERGLTRWRKPLSCHLFPVRIRHFGKDYLRYEMIEECAPGRLNGESARVPLAGFLREPLVRRYGQAWYDEFMRACAAHAAADQGEAC